MNMLLKKLTSVRKKSNLTEKEQISLDDFIVSMMPKTGTFLRLWTNNHIIEELDGHCEKQMFESHFVEPDVQEHIGYSNISNRDHLTACWKEFTEEDLSTGKMKFERHMLVNSCCCEHMYREAGRDINQLVFTKPQILSIFRNHNQLFVKDNRLHLFFYKSRNEKTFTFFIAFDPDLKMWWYYIMHLPLELTRYQLQNDTWYEKKTILFLPQNPNRHHLYMR